MLAYRVAYVLPKHRDAMVTARALDFPGLVSEGWNVADARTKITGPSEPWSRIHRIASATGRNRANAIAAASKATTHTHRVQASARGAASVRVSFGELMGSVPAITGQ